MLDHFAECIKQAKGVRQQAVQLNIFTAVLSALKVRKLATYPHNIMFHYTVKDNVSHPSFLTEGFGRKQEYSGP